eukprot:CAMPEP_0171322780 /NCGR_PEP_ID=MMETSP0816-20121228/115171_1 /TAXON_ID=420281 /ORGANISM="Proboscia inermis, Strain CCAP1064/1" /LENGTH=110 /DNA_ID=CAMNT_0011821339 /DNA_START=175 /DNA_END=508 /DNA_ORIENTATION=+
MAWRGSASVGGMPSDGNSFLEKAAEARIRRRRQRFLCPVSHSNGETTVAVPGLFLDGGIMLRIPQRTSTVNTSSLISEPSEQLRPTSKDPATAPFQNNRMLQREEDACKA